MSYTHVFPDSFDSFFRIVSISSLRYGNSSAFLTVLVLRRSANSFAASLRISRFDQILFCIGFQRLHHYACKERIRHVTWFFTGTLSSRTTRWKPCGSEFWGRRGARSLWSLNACPSSASPSHWRGPQQGEGSKAGFSRRHIAKSRAFVNGSRTQRRAKSLWERKIAVFRGRRHHHPRCPL